MSVDLKVHGGAYIRMLQVNEDNMREVLSMKVVFEQELNSITKH